MKYRFLLAAASTAALLVGCTSETGPDGAADPEDTQAAAPVGPDATGTEDDTKDDAEDEDAPDAVVDRGSSPVELEPGLRTVEFDDLDVTLDFNLDEPAEVVGMVFEVGEPLTAARVDRGDATVTIVVPDLLYTFDEDGTQDAIEHPSDPLGTIQSDTDAGRFIETVAIDDAVSTVYPDARLFTANVDEYSVNPDSSRRGMFGRTVTDDREFEYGLRSDGSQMWVAAIPYAYEKWVMVIAQAEDDGALPLWFELVGYDAEEGDADGE
jgi:hypothetical protein